MTYTYVKLEVSQSTYEEIAEKLKDAHYDHAFIHEGPRVEKPVIDMHGIGLVCERAP